MPPNLPTPAGSDSKADSTALIAKLNELGSEFMTAQEWGIFCQEPSGPDPLETEIITELETLRKEAEAGHTAAAQTALLKAKSLFSRAQDRYWWYKINNQYGILPIGFTLLGVLFAFYSIYGWMTALPSHLEAAHAAMMGLLGAALRMLYWLQFQLNKGQLRPRWIAVFLVAPFIGGLLGTVSYLMVVVGFKLASVGATVKADTLAIGLIAAFAGYNWEWALEKFLVAADALAAKFGARGNTTAKPASGSR